MAQFGPLKFENEWPQQRPL